jgi:formylglycine-generating enzyme required for sulfatase activity
VHEVVLPGFYIGRHEVTAAEFEAFRQGLRKLGRARAAAGRRPAASVSWKEAIEFCRHMSSIDRAGAVYRLPTEAEWEYAARGKEARTYAWGNDPPGLEHANLKGGSDGHEAAAPVGSFPKGATPSGVHDMAGNVAEWCADWYGPYRAGRQSSPSGPVRGKLRSVRGGTFIHGPSWARAAARGARRPDEPVYLIGFRVVRELTDDERKFEKLAAGGAGKEAPGGGFPGKE